MRISPVVLQEKRAAKSSRILLTGGTGFLGSHIAIALLQEGYEVVLLARGKGGFSAEARIGQILDWFGLEMSARQKLRVIEAKLSEPELGLSPETYAHLCAAVDETVHCASDTSFSEKRRAEVESGNISALQNILDLASRSGCFFFHHLSTAYAAGKTDGLCREELSRAASFHNVYEETKCRGEWLAQEKCRDKGIRLNIYRPSIVYGDSRTGRSLLFNALYYPVKTALFLKKLYERDIHEKGGKKAAEMGIRLEGDGWIHLPIRIEVASGGGVNLVPVDFFADAFMALFEEGLGGEIFHIVNSKLKKIEDIVEFARRLYHLKGVETCPAEEFMIKPRNALEVLFDSYLEAYNPYMRDTRTFSTENSNPVIQKRGLACPEFDFPIFERCMSFAVDSGWGSRLFTKA